MKKIKLSFNQSKKLVWNNQSIRVKQNGEVLYIDMIGNEIVVKTWLGSIVNTEVIIDECFR